MITSCQFGNTELVENKEVENKEITNLPEPMTVRQLNSILAGVTGDIQVKKFPSDKYKGLMVYEYTIKADEEKYVIQYLYNKKTEVLNTGNIEIDDKPVRLLSLIMIISNKRNGIYKGLI